MIESSKQNNADLHGVGGGTGEGFTPRQAEVLEVALNLLTQGGEKSLTTTAIARQASCSKESLYKWFGDRDGIIKAIVVYQASKVGVQAETMPIRGMNNTDLHHCFYQFIRDVMAVLFSQTSLAMNRLAIASAGSDKPQISRYLLSLGKQQIAAHTKKILKRGQQIGLWQINDVDDAFSTLYGLMIRDEYIRLLLGDTVEFSAHQHNMRASQVVDQFHLLYGAR